MNRARFFLGTHHPPWLESLDVSLCVSRARLTGRKTFPRARRPWMLDSGAFSEIATNGRWTISAGAYAREVRHFATEVGEPAQVAPQDWMCEPQMIAKTGLSVSRHQALTTANFLELRDIGVKTVFPVLQGWVLADYLRHADSYAKANVALDRLPVVGVGSICRRQNKDEISLILHALAAQGLKLHGFGVKMQGLEKAGCALESADSMAWSFNARRLQRPWCDEKATHINCANCAIYAQAWRTQMLNMMGGRRPCSLCH